MTKEEILRKNIGLLPYINSYEKSNSIFDAMSEYAKQQSIELAEFMKEFGCRSCGEREWILEFDPRNEIIDPKTYTSDQLYNLFLDHQLKQQV